MAYRPQASRAQHGTRTPSWLSWCTIKAQIPGSYGRTAAVHALCFAYTPSDDSTHARKNKIVLRGQIRKKRNEKKRYLPPVLLSTPQRTEECGSACSRSPHRNKYQGLGRKQKEACKRHLELTTDAKRGNNCAGEAKGASKALILLTGPVMAR